MAVPFASFSGHRQVNALGPIFAANSEAFRDSVLRKIVLIPKTHASNLRFPSVTEMKRVLGEEYWPSAYAEGNCENSASVPEQVSDELLHHALPESWIRSASSEGTPCTAEKYLMHVDTPVIRLHAIRHAYAHTGGWSALSSEDRLKAMYAVRQRLLSQDRIRFAHVEHSSHPLESIREYWAELLAFAFGVAAKHEAEWRRVFLARAVQRSACAPCAYPSSQTGEADLALVRWYLDRARIEEPWAYAARAAEWLKYSEAEDHLSSIRHAISGFPPGKLRMVFSALLQPEIKSQEDFKDAGRMEQEISPNLITWVEQACAFADELVSLHTGEEAAGLLSTSAGLAADLQRFSQAERREAVDAVHRYIEALVNPL
jgi:hypothetical protein